MFWVDIRLIEACPEAVTNEYGEERRFLARLRRRPEARRAGREAAGWKGPPRRLAPLLGPLRASDGTLGRT